MIDRIRSRPHRQFVSLHQCLVCRAAPPSDPHHLKFAQPRGMSIKSSDRFCVPLCRKCHDEVEVSGDERAWWSKKGIDPLVAAEDLWMGEVPF